ncbi:MAG: methyltransferase [Planctomycetia bacterium]|nr:methyltransferase [Planctomycetia bacterium]
MSSQISYERLKRVASGFQESSVLTAAAEMDLFTVILTHENELSAKKLAEILQADVRGITVLLDALAASEYLNKSGVGTQANYAVSEPFMELLDSRSVETYIPMLRHMANLQRAWSQLTWTVKEGAPQTVPPSILGAQEDYNSFLWAMNSVGRVLVKPVVESLQKSGVLDFTKNTIRFLDVGGASGTYTQAFLDVLPDSCGAIFDLPLGILAAKKRFVGTKYESRVEFLEGDFGQDNFPSGFDFAWLGAIIHQYDISETCELFRKVYRALNSGGKIAVRDFIMEENRIRPRDGAFFGVNMLLNTKRGMVYTYKEVRDALRVTGFTEIEYAVPAESMAAIVVARKP